MEKYNELAADEKSPAGGAATEVKSDNPVPLLKPKAASRCVKLFGRGDTPWVNGKDKKPLTKAQYDAVLALIEAGDKGLTKDRLDRKSHHTDVRKILKRLAESDPNWKSVIVFPETPGEGYRIR